MEELIEFELDGERVRVPPGLSVAAALLHLGRRVLRTDRRALPRGLFCGMGVCLECTMEIDGRPSERACMILVRPGLRVRSQHGLPQLEASK